ncbi:MAG TPA: MarR family winged helix-turn-helix transcriptional regulator [Edaphobacter sp.]|nr:MarR family winged helix-turn-helix transcriptional regulator [Edaphobacter sp.]
MRARRTDDASSGGLSCALAATRRTARLMTQFYDACLAEAGIEAAQFALLMALDTAKDKGQAALGQMLGMDKTTLSRNLKVLREKGWAESVAGEDARKRCVSLTAEGQARLREAKPAWRRAGERFREEMTEGEWTAMWSSLEAMNGAVGRAGERKNS